MALFNENRNRIPQVEALPVTGDDGGIRGQMRMLDVGGTDIAVCTVSDEDTFSELTVSTSGGDVGYLSIAVGDAGASVTVTHDDTGVTVPVITVVNTDIVVLGNTSTTSTQIVTAIEASAEASALVTAIDNGGTLVAANAASLTGGNGTKAAVTILNDLVVTAATSGKSGDDITIEIVENVGAAHVVTSVSGTAITVSGDPTATTADIAIAINSNANATSLISAAGTAGNTLATVAATNLVGGASLAVWGTLAVV